MTALIEDKDYIESGGSQCPNCKQETITAGFSPESSGGLDYLLPVACTNCGAECTEVYQLVGYTNYKLPREE